jgi:hypothetical protein
MSSALAIAGVSAVLTDLLDNGIIDNNLTATVGPVKVSAKPPDRVPPVGGSDPNQLNLFLYHVSPNPGWQNRSLPSRDGDGARLTNPPLALDLFYLLTAYGESDFQAEILLGYAMQLFHETPVLTRDAIRAALGIGPHQPVKGTVLPGDFKALVAADLAEQVEQIKIIPQTMSTEEMSKLWTALQTSYRPTAAYQVSVVLIESRRPTRTTFPVRERILEVVPFQRPAIESVESDAGPGEPITASSTIIIQGRQLRGAITSVLIDGSKFIPTPSDLGDNEIKIVLGSQPGALRAGVQGVQVMQEIALGKPPQPHRGVESNVAALILHPIPGLFNFAAGIGTAPGTLTVTFDPEVGRSQRVMLLLGERNPPTGTAGISYSIAAPPDNGITTAGTTKTPTITFLLKGVPVGQYFVRVQVDGAESALIVDASGNFVGPVVTIS